MIKLHMSRHTIFFAQGSLTCSAQSLITLLFVAVVEQDVLEYRFHKSGMDVILIGVSKQYLHNLTEYHCVILFAFLIPVSYYLQLSPLLSTQVSCVLAMGVNITNFGLIAKTSVLTFQVIKSGMRCFLDRKYRLSRVVGVSIA